MIARNTKSRLTPIFALLAIVAAVAGCAPAPGEHYPLDTLSPKSDVTQKFYDLFYEITAIDIVILIVVTVIFFLALLVFSSRVGDVEEPSHKHSDVYLEMAWTVIPSIIVVMITVPTVRVIMQTQPDHWSADTLEVRVIAGVTGWENLGDAVTETIIWVCLGFSLLLAAIVLQLQELCRARPIAAENR